MAAATVALASEAMQDAYTKAVLRGRHPRSWPAVNCDIQKLVRSSVERYKGVAHGV
jgi:hypothetical protein